MTTIPSVSDGSFRGLADADEKTGVLNGKQRCENEEEDPARFSLEVYMTLHDPGHPQPPPDGPSTSHGQKQPHYADAPGTDPLAPQQPRKKGRRWLPILLTLHQTHPQPSPHVEAFSERQTTLISQRLRKLNVF